MRKIKIFNSTSIDDIEKEFNDFFKDENKKIINIRYGTAGEGGFNRDGVLVYYEE